MPLEGHFGSLPERDRSAEIPIRRGKYIDVEVFGELFATSGTFDSVTISNATITSATITGSVTVGSITINGATGQITLGSNAVLDDAGYIAFGSTPPTSYGNNVGIWIGDDAGTGKASFYSDASNYLQWNGSALSLAGTIDANAGTLGSLTIAGTLTMGASGQILTNSAGNDRTVIDQTQIQFFDSSDTNVAGISYSTANGNLHIESTNEVIRLDAPFVYLDTIVDIGFHDDNWALRLWGDYTKNTEDGKWTWDAFESPAGTENLRLLYDHDQITGMPASIMTHQFSGFDPLPGTLVTKHYGLFGVEDGAAGTPSFHFNDDTDTGLYRSTTNTIAFATGGTLRGTISTNGIRMVDGSFSTPAYSFTNDTAMGMYKEGTDVLGLASGTGGKGLSLGDGYLKIHRKNADTTEGGELQFEGGTSYGNAMYIDRHSNNLRMVYNAAEKIRIQSTGDVTTIGALRAGAVGGTLTAGSLYSIPQTSASPAPGAGSQAKWILATGSTYYLARYTSSARYKKDIKPWDGRERVTDIDVMSFIGANRKPVLDEDGEVVEWVEEWGDTPVIGAIAEQVAKAYPQAAVYDEDGRPESIDTDAVLWGMLHEIKQLRYEAEQWKKLKVGECRCNCGV